MPDVCRAYDAYEAYEVWKRFFREDGGRERLSTHGVRTPSTARGAVPLPRRGRSGGLRRSRPTALTSIGYRGFAVAPMTLRASSRSLLYNPGCKVETLLVSKGVMGFLGDLRGRNSKSPPNPLGLAERVYSFHRPRGGSPPSKREVWGLRRSRPSAFPSITYRGFAVAPITLRAPARRVIITSGINGRAMRAPTGDGGATDGCKYI